MLCPLNKRLLGLLALLGTVLIWVGSAQLIQFIFHDAEFNKPFFLTYFSITLFSLYLSGFLIFSGWKQDSFASCFRKLRKELKEGYILPSSANSNSDSEERLSLPEVIRVALVFFPVYFLANYTYNAGVNLTTVASSTILSSSSSFFTVLLSWFTKIDSVSVFKILGVVAALCGVILVSVQDSEEDKKLTVHLQLFGDALSLSSAFLYASYAVLLKKLVYEAERLHMPMFLGFVGVLTCLFMWPFLFILSALGIESLEWPGGKVETV